MDEVICLREWMRGQQSPVRMTLVCGVLTAVYFGAGKLGLQWAIAHPNITMVCPSTGVALAALLIFGYRVWPGVVAGTLLVHLTTGIGVQACLGIAAGNMLAALASAFLVNQFANGLRAFERPRDVLLFTLFSGLIASTISATIGVLSLGTAWNEFLRQCTTWWQGDAVAAPSWRRRCFCGRRTRALTGRSENAARLWLSCLCCWRSACSYRPRNAVMCWPWPRCRC